MNPKIREALLYTGVNLASTVVDYAIFLTLTHLFGLPIIQSIISYAVTAVVNYGLTRRFVFRHGLSPKSEHRRFLEFAITTVGGVILTALVIWVSVHEMNLPPIEGKTISLLACFVSLYYVRTRIVFSKNTDDQAVA